MISKDDLKKFSKAYNLTFHQQEQHYIQTATLQGIYTAVANQLVFKGGTAMFFFYGLNRFSEDLDFTQIQPLDIDYLKTTLSNVFFILNIPHDVKTETKPAGITIKVKTKGPLYNKPLSTTTVKIDISERNDVMQLPNTKEVAPCYDDLRPFTVPVMTKQEILAEKIRALMIRGKARDVYDVAFLIKKGITWDLNLVNKKLEYYDTTFNQSAFIRKLKSIQKIWKAELQGLVPMVPLFNEEVSIILNHIQHSSE